MDQGFFCRIRGIDGVPQNCEVAARSPPLAAGRTDARNGPACVGFIDRSERESYPRIECVLSFCQCPSVADENREAMRTTSLMDDCNASALMPLRESSIAVLSPRVFSEWSPSANRSKGFSHSMPGVFVTSPRVR